MNKFELIDTNEKFELKVNGNPIPNIVGYKIEATPFNKRIQLELSIPKKDISIITKNTDASSYKTSTNEKLDYESGKILL